MDAAQIATLAASLIAAASAGWAALMRYREKKAKADADREKAEAQARATQATVSAEVDRVRVTTSGELAIVEAQARRELDTTALGLVRELVTAMREEDRERREEERSCDEKIDKVRKELRAELREERESCIEKIREVYGMAQKAQLDAHTATEAAETLRRQHAPYLGTRHNGSPTHSTPPPADMMEESTPTPT